MQFDQLKRRGLITVLGVAAVWPLAARVWQPERMRRIGVLSGIPLVGTALKARSMAK